MSKVVENDVTNVTEQIVEELDPTVVYATLVKEDDGYHVIDFDGTNLPCKLDKTGQWIVLPKNKSNRKCMSVAAATRGLAESDHIDLYYKAARHVGSTGPSMPSKWVLKYLSEDEQAEYIAIIDRARAAKLADKPAPKTEADKLRDQIAKLEAKLASIPVEG